MHIKITRSKGHCYAALVKSVRVNGKPDHVVIRNFGAVDEAAIPYLKAAFAKDKPKLLYSDGTVYDPNAS